MLASHTLETARQEVLAVLLAMAVVKRMRIGAGETLGVPVPGVSFLKVLQLTRQPWESFAWSEGARAATRRPDLYALLRGPPSPRASTDAARMILSARDPEAHQLMAQKKPLNQASRARFPSRFYPCPNGVGAKA